jgi:hypothetical protein
VAPLQRAWHGRPDGVIVVSGESIQMRPHDMGLDFGSTRHGDHMETGAALPPRRCRMLVRQRGLRLFVGQRKSTREPRIAAAALPAATTREEKTRLRSNWQVPIVSPGDGIPPPRHGKPPQWLMMPASPLPGVCRIANERNAASSAPR